MNCKVQGVYKNPRYRILLINEERYILDMGNSFWRILFPFFRWMVPSTAYKVNNLEIIEKIKTPEVKQKEETGPNSMMAGVIGIILANLLRPLANVFNIPSTQLVNSIIVMIVFLIILVVFYYINIRSKKSLTKVIDLEDYSMKRLWIRPQSYKHFFFILFSYLFFLTFTVVPFLGFIQTGDVLIFFVGIFFLFFTLFISVLTVALGDNKVVIKNNEKAAI